MSFTKAETLLNIQDKLSLFEVPKFFYFSINDFLSNRKKILKKITREFNSEIIVRSSSAQEDGATYSYAGEFESLLNINPKDLKEVESAILSVIDSYRHKNFEKDQIIIQDMVKLISMSGVAFTHDLNNGSPYYVVNYDDQSGSTDTVTSGNSEYSNRTLYIYRNALNELSSKRFLILIKAIKELEVLLDNEFLDIEFALGLDLKPYLLQVRQISTKRKWKSSSKKLIDAALRKVSSQIKKDFKRSPGVYGETTVLGQMPDWNPVEMLGRTPKALARSLYCKLITEETWKTARSLMGYSLPRENNLMKVYAGQPFIDTRMSFHSFLPSDLPPTIGEKLVNHWVLSLSKSPELHDKVEFDIAITCFSFNFDEKMNNLIGKVLSNNEKEIFKKCHLRLLQNLLSENGEGSLHWALNKIDLLSKNQKKKKPLKSMLDECIELGTLPFSILARHGFIAKEILDSLVDLEILTLRESILFQSSINTIASKLVKDVNSLKMNRLSKNDFMKKYGHLRPGSYDIMSKRYDQMDDLFSSNESLGKSKKLIKKEKFNLSSKQKKSIDSLLNFYGFINFTSEDLFRYIELSIKGREYGKFVFTKTLSDILELISNFLNTLGLNRETISHIPIECLLDSFNKIKMENNIDYLLKISKKESKNYAINNLIRFPQLLINEQGVFVVPFQVSRPNFITSEKVTAKIKILSSDSDTKNLDNKIVVIEGADPGFDWIFSFKILGLITKFGGANSHMAIRCAEFGIPAAIGCGEQRFESILNCKQVHLDCSSELISPLQ